MPTSLNEGRGKEMVVALSVSDAGDVVGSCWLVDDLANLSWGTEVQRDGGV